MFSLYIQLSIWSLRIQKPSSLQQSIPPTLSPSSCSVQGDSIVLVGQAKTSAPSWSLFLFSHSTWIHQQILLGLSSKYIHLLLTTSMGTALIKWVTSSPWITVIYTWRPWSSIISTQPAQMVPFKHIIPHPLHKILHISMHTWPWPSSPTQAALSPPRPYFLRSTLLALCQPRGPCCLEHSKPQGLWLEGKINLQITACLSPYLLQTCAPHSNFIELN
jgi:hypothetical protein